MPSLEERQVLHPFMCEQFGFENLRSMLDCMDKAGAYKWQLQDDISIYANALLPKIRNVNRVISEQQLLRYDNNITQHSRKLAMDSEHRNWKPFQYLALLFTEHYLKRYFNDKEELLIDLQKAQNKHSIMKGRSPYEFEDLQTIAFQSATGSGKTLIMHANILQYLHYLEYYGKHRSLNKIILLTPDEGMSDQHLKELNAIGAIDARKFSGDSHDLWKKGAVIVDIIDLYKLADKSVIKKVAVESFGGNNLVIIDEGHLGPAGKTWREYRAELSRDGFTMEYSATFNQAVSAPGAVELCNSYGKSLLFDYSYKYFYSDGYGKDYSIKNLPKDEVETTKIYLLACLLQFYQQCLVYDDNNNNWRAYNIAPPLLVFLGRQVTGGNNADKEMQSDIVRVVELLAWVIGNKIEVIREIENIIKGKTGIIGNDGNDIFEHSFPYIKSKSASTIYKDMSKKIFNNEGKLHVVHAKSSDEILLRVGVQGGVQGGDQAGEAFAVINVGKTFDLFKMIKKIEGHNFETEPNKFANEEFSKVDNHDSNIKMVIGAKKFVAGWSSWRVSTMGLLNVGQGAGSQIIQMFGRGVRLKGKGMCLKRHRAYEGNLLSDSDSKNLALLETLNIFGLRANYMEQFKEYLEEEGLPVEWETITIRVVENFAESPDIVLPQIPDDVPEFAKSEVRFKLDNEKAKAPVELNLLTKIQIIEKAT